MPASVAVSALGADRAHDAVAVFVLDIGDDRRALFDVVAADRVAWRLAGHP